MIKLGILISNLFTNPQSVREVTNVNVKIELVSCVVVYYPIPNTSVTHEIYSLYLRVCGYILRATFSGMPRLKARVTDKPPALQGAFECLNMIFAKGVICTWICSVHSILTTIL